MTVRNSEESVSNSSLLVGAEIIRKRRERGFIFKARDLSITLSAPMETFDESAKKVTGVPPGMTNKQVMYSIDRYILGRGDDEMGEVMGVILKRF